MISGKSEKKIRDKKVFTDLKKKKMKWSFNIRIQNDIDYLNFWLFKWLIIWTQDEYLNWKTVFKKIYFLQNISVFFKIL